MEGGKATLMTGAGLEAFLVDAMEAVNIHFIGSVSDLDNEEKEGYQPEFVHQHFGEKEQIFGYTDLHVDIHYTSASMFIYPTISFDKRIDKVHKDLAPDDIITQLKEQLPKGEMDMMFSSRDQFVKEIEKQESFRPAGTLVNKYSVVNADGVKEQFEVYKVSESSPEFDSYLARVQTVALWYIDACEYTDNSDERWMHYFVYEKTKSSTGGDCVALAGYMSVYNFYAYPQHQRPRIA
uniref:histone acetyltransferase n=1 Tax=Plectus sambesii TaxID=2011161 RepID=A0A914WG23_9BILA